MKKNYVCFRQLLSAFLKWSLLCLPWKVFRNIWHLSHPSLHCTCTNRATEHAHGMCSLSQHAFLSMRIRLTQRNWRLLQTGCSGFLLGIEILEYHGFHLIKGMTNWSFVNGMEFEVFVKKMLDLICRILIQIIPEACMLYDRFLVVIDINIIFDLHTVALIIYCAYFLTPNCYYTQS